MKPVYKTMSNRASKNQETFGTTKYFACMG